jgi:hypothetical protein
MGKIVKSKTDVKGFDMRKNTRREKNAEENLKKLCEREWWNLVCSSAKL